MDYLSMIPSEILSLILSDLNIKELAKLTSDELFNKILNDDIFWFTYFKEYGLPIITKRRGFSFWANEFNYTYKSFDATLVLMSNYKSWLEITRNTHPIEVIYNYIDIIDYNLMLAENSSIFITYSKDPLYLEFSKYIEPPRKEILIKITDKTKIFDFLFKTSYYKM